MAAATRRPAARAAPSPLVLAVLLLAASSLPAAAAAAEAPPAPGAGRRLRRGRRAMFRPSKHAGAAGTAEGAPPPGEGGEGDAPGGPPTGAGDGPGEGPGDGGAAGDGSSPAGDEGPEPPTDPPEEVVEVVANLEQTIEELESSGAGGGAAEQAAEALLDEAESLIAATFPEGCSWECYVENNAGLKRMGYATEENAIRHWLRKGRDGGWDCRCGTDGLDGAETEAAQEAIEEEIEDPDDEGGEDAAQEKQALVDEAAEGGEEEVFQVVEDIEETIEELEESGGAVAEVEAEELEEEAGTLIEETFPEGCSWECYLDHHAGLKKRYNTEEQAIKHWLRTGRERGWNCSCKAKDVGEEEVAETVEDLETTIQHLAEEGGAVAEGEIVQLEEEAKLLIEETFPEGCTWGCYLDNNPELKQRFHTEEDAIQSWLAHGRDEGKDCTCEGGDVVQEVENIEKTIKALDDEGGAYSEREKVGLMTKASKLIQETFPEGCTWDCYIDNNPGLRKRYGTEEMAIKHWLRVGEKNGRDCACHGGDVDSNDVAEVVEKIEGLIEDLDDEGGVTAEEEIEQLEEEAQSLIETTFPEGCTWECYLDNNPGLKKRLRNKKAAIRHWLKKGQDQGRDCSCKGQDTGGSNVDDAGFDQSQRLRRHKW